MHYTPIFGQILDSTRAQEVKRFLPQNLPRQHQDEQRGQGISSTILQVQQHPEHFLWRWNSKNFERWEAKKGQLQEGGVIETNPWLVNSLASERMADQHTSLLSNMAVLASSLF